MNVKLKILNFSFFVAMTFVSSELALAVSPSEGGERNFDARVTLIQGITAAQSTAQIAAVDRIRRDVPNLSVTYDSATGVTRTLRNRTGFLTDARPDADAFRIALDFISTNSAALGLSGGDVAEYEVTDLVQNRVTGTTNIYLRQIASGLPVYNGQLQVNINRDGRVMSVSNAFMADVSKALNTVQPSVDVTDAVSRAAKSIGIAADSEAVSAPQLMLLPIQRGDARLVWNFQLPTPDLMHYYDFTVDAVTGEVWTRFDWVAEAEYTVVAAPAESPNHLPVPPPNDGRTVEIDPHDLIASPFGWHDTDGISGSEFTIHRGNNVHAYEDRDRNNQPPLIEPDCGPSLICDFNFPIDFGTQQPSTYVDAAVTNLFYWNNIIHDIQYQYGFDELAGNFQVNNYGNGGLGNDDVRAEAQDGESLCNANMLTLPDGQRPRMQMFVCNIASPQRDGDFDNAVIVHEYGHGISIRSVGGPSNTSCLNNLQQMGEGISDFLGLVYTAEVGDAGQDARGIGTYLFGQAADGPGIRTAPYSTDFAVNGSLYSDISGQAIPHGVGWVWASAAWEAYWELVNLRGFDPDLYNALGTAGNQRMMLYLQEAMQTVNCSPTFLDLRDAIIQSATNNHGGEDVCPLWEAFARRGQGVSAFTAGPNSTTATNGFDVPSECGVVTELTLSAPMPGTAGVENTFDVTGVTPSGPALLFAGFGSGSFQVPGCPAGVTIDINNPRRLGSATADASGNATISRLLPSGLSGRTMNFQAVDRGACTVSNLVNHTFP